MYKLEYTPCADADIDLILESDDIEAIEKLNAALIGLSVKGYRYGGHMLTSADVTATGVYDFTGYHTYAFSTNGIDYRIISQLLDNNVIEVVRVGNRDTVYLSPIKSDK